MPLVTIQPRRSFIKVAVGVGSMPLASWATPSGTPFNIENISEIEKYQRLPKTNEPLILSGRVVGLDQSPLPNQGIALDNKQVTTTTDADGRFCLKASAVDFIDANYQLNIETSNADKTTDLKLKHEMLAHPLIQDSLGNWRIYIEVQI